MKRLGRIDLLAREREATFQELTEEAVAIYSKKYHRVPNFRMRSESARHLKEHMNGKQRTHRRQLSHRRGQEAHAV